MMPDRKWVRLAQAFDRYRDALEGLRRTANGLVGSTVTVAAGHHGCTNVWVTSSLGETRNVDTATFLVESCDWQDDPEWLVIHGVDAAGEKVGAYIRWRSRMVDPDLLPIPPPGRPIETPYGEVSPRRSVWAWFCDSLRRLFG